MKSQQKRRIKIVFQILPQSKDILILKTVLIKKVHKTNGNEGIVQYACTVIPLKKPL